MKWFYIRIEGSPYKSGLNATKIPDGFVLVFMTKKHKYRFRFRRGIKPHFLWSKEP